MASVKETLAFLFFCLSLFCSIHAEVLEPKNINYDIFIKTTKEHYEDTKGPQLNFSGEVNVKFELANNPKEKDLQIILDASVSTTLKSAILNGEKNSKFEKIASGVLEKGKIIFKFTNSSIAEIKKFQANIEYMSTFGNDMVGFYRSSYKHPKEGNRWILTTQFEPIFARNAFPCFDKPHLKATFELKFEVPAERKNYFVLANTPCNFTSPPTIWKCKKNEPVMSTYLVAFTISDFNHTKKVEFDSDFPNKSKRQLQTFGQESMIANEAELSLTAGKDAVEELSKYLNKGYAFEKVDQVGIPDFSAGAMENWGLITFREKILFFNEKTGSIFTKQGNIMTITHELVHQWFGNLVTLETWDYIWLNEAFATYFQYLISHKIKTPNTSDWMFKEQLLVNEIHSRAFETDAMVSANPLNLKIENEDLIFSHFNDIPYSKGCAILRMWDLSLPNNLFQKSLQQYIKDREAKTANPSQLYSAFKNVATMDEKFFKVWTENPGYPVIEVKKSKNGYTLSQTRFLYEESKTSNVTYVVPLTYTTNDILNSADWNTVPKKFLADKNGQIESNASWIILNNKQAGYYRVNYDKDNWNALANVLKKNLSQIHELNRAQIVNDIFSLARSLQKDYVGYGTALSLSEYLMNEKSYVPWKTALNSFDFLQNKLYKDENVYEMFKTFILKLLKPNYVGLESKGLKHTETIKNIEISRWACALNYNPCVKEALNFYKNSSSYPNTREIILCTSIRNNEKIWNEVFEIYQKEQDSATKVMYLTSLGCTQDQNIVLKFLNKTFDPTSGIRKQDTIYVMQAVYNGNFKNVDVAFEFVIKNFKRIALEYGGINPLGRILLGLSKKLNTPEDLTKMKNLVKEMEKTEEAKAAMENAKTALSIIETNISWGKQRKGQIQVYFKNSGTLLSYSFGLLSASFLIGFKL